VEVLAGEGLVERLDQRPNRMTAFDQRVDDQPPQATTGPGNQDEHGERAAAYACLTAERSRVSVIFSPTTRLPLPSACVSLIA
jgi:hypothetical protein